MVFWYYKFIRQAGFVLAFFHTHTHTAKREIQTAKRKSQTQLCIYTQYTLRNASNMPLRTGKNAQKKKEKQMPLQKGKCMVLKLPYNGQNTLRSDRSFMYHQQALHAMYTFGIVYVYYG